MGAREKINMVLIPSQCFHFYRIPYLYIQWIASSIVYIVLSSRCLVILYRKNYEIMYLPNTMTSFLNFSHTYVIILCVSPVVCNKKILKLKFWKKTHTTNNNLLANPKCLNLCKSKIYFTWILKDSIIFYRKYLGV